MLSKNERIKQTLQETRIKRAIQRCAVFIFKINTSKLNKSDFEKLQMFFVENKRLYNYLLSLEDLKTFDTKTRNITYKDKYKNDISYTLTMPAKMIQTNHKTLCQNIKSLANIKKKGRKTGKLKFKSEYNSIELNQYGVTHEIKSKDTIRITGIKKPLKVHGLAQLKAEYEFANAKLIKRPTGYYIALTCYENLKANRIKKPVNEVGLDFGIKTHITTSNGEKFNITIEESVRLKGLQKKLSRQKVKGTNNRYKTILKIRKEYEKITNKKKDKTNKLVNYLCTSYLTVYMQDELIKGWHKGLFGKQVQHSCLGTLKSKLIHSSNVIVLPSYVPTTKLCYNCGSYHKDISLNDRDFVCKCGLNEDRDIKAAKTILFIGQCKNTYIPVGRRNTSVEKMSDFLSSLELKKQFLMKQEANVL